MWLCVSCSPGEDSKVIATGGTSTNVAILQVLSDVFGVSVYVTDVPNSAALGGCYRAMHSKWLMCYRAIYVHV